jgi:hypothetical protein
VSTAAALSADVALRPIVLSGQPGTTLPPHLRFDTIGPINDINKASMSAGQKEHQKRKYKNIKKGIVKPSTQEKRKTHFCDHRAAKSPKFGLNKLFDQIEDPSGQVIPQIL